MEKFKIIKSSNEKYMLIIYPFIDNKDISYGFKFDTKDLYLLKLELDEILNNHINQSNES